MLLIGSIGVVHLNARSSFRFREQDLRHRHVVSFRKPFQCVEDAVGAGIYRDG